MKTIENKTGLPDEFVERVAEEFKKRRTKDALHSGTIDHDLPRRTPEVVIIIFPMHQSSNLEKPAGLQYYGPVVSPDYASCKYYFFNVEFNNGSI